jgi:hypothetical protein
VTRLLLSIVLLAMSCAPVTTPTSTQRFPMYQYSLQFPTKPVSPNERVTLAWEPRLQSESSPSVYEIQLCVALFGPWQSVEALKNAPQPNTRSCPPPGAIAMSETLRTPSNTGSPQAATITVPSAPGFYDVRQISVYSGSSATSAGSVIEVR